MIRLLGSWRYSPVGRAVMVMAVFHSLVYVSPTGAGGAANESPLAAARQASDQTTSCSAANDWGMFFPPVLVLVPVGYGYY